MKKVGLTILILCLNLFCSGQIDSIEVKGFALSEVEQRPLKNAEIIINISGKPAFQVLTGTDGKFYFKLKRVNTIATLYSQSNKNTTDGIKTGQFLPRKDDPKINLATDTSFIHTFYFQELVH